MIMDKTKWAEAYFHQYKRSLIWSKL
jgi:hypothetical protein